MTAIIWSWAINNKGLSATLLALALSLAALGWVSLDRAWLRVDLANARSALAAIESGREAFRARAEDEVKRLDRLAARRAHNFNTATERFDHAPTDALPTDRDRAVLDCLRQLRAGLPCAAP